MIDLSFTYKSEEISPKSKEPIDEGPFFEVFETTSKDYFVKVYNNESLKLNKLMANNYMKKIDKIELVNNLPHSIVDS